MALLQKESSLSIGCYTLPSHHDSHWQRSWSLCGLKHAKQDPARPTLLDRSCTSWSTDCKRIIRRLQARRKKQRRKDLIEDSRRTTVGDSFQRWWNLRHHLSSRTENQCRHIATLQCQRFRPFSLYKERRSIKRQRQINLSTAVEQATTMNGNSERDFV